MRIKKVWAVYFSGTGTTEKTVRRIAAGMAQALDAELAVYDFTTPAARQRELRHGGAGGAGRTGVRRARTQRAAALSDEAAARRRTGGAGGAVRQPEL